MMYGNEDYKQQLKEFMQSINPKPTLEQIEKLKQTYLDRRNSNEQPKENDETRTDG